MISFIFSIFIFIVHTQTYVTLSIGRFKMTKRHIQYIDIRRSILSNRFLDDCCTKDKTCADTDGSGVAFSSGICVAAGMLRRSDWTSAPACAGLCETADCCAAVGTLSNQVNLIDSINLDTPYSVTVSPDGKNVYALGLNSDSIVHWDRDSATGALTNQVNLIDSTNLDGARGLAVSPDGKNVYAVAGSSDSIVYWDRDSTTGALTNQVNLIDSTNLNGAFRVVVSPDGKNVYATAMTSDSIVYWDRDAATGALTNQVNLIDSTNLIASASKDCKLIISTALGTVLCSYHHPGTVYGCAWNSNFPNILSSTCEDGQVRIFQCVHIWEKRKKKNNFNPKVNFNIFSNYCQLNPTCNNRGVCKVTSSTSSTCQCGDGLSAGSQCESCPKGKIEKKNRLKKWKKLEVTWQPLLRRKTTTKMSQ